MIATVHASYDSRNASGTVQNCLPLFHCFCLECQLGCFLVCSSLLYTIGGNKAVPTHIITSLVATYLPVLLHPKLPCPFLPLRFILWPSDGAYIITLGMSGLVQDLFFVCMATWLLLLELLLFNCERSFQSINLNGWDDPTHCRFM